MLMKPPIGATLQRGHPLARGLVAAYLMNEGGGLTAHDASGMGNHGTLTDMDPATDWVHGALDFDGSNDVVYAPISGVNYPFSLCFRGRLLSSDAASHVLLGIGDGAGTTYSSLYWDAYERLGLLRYQGAARGTSTVNATITVGESFSGTGVFINSSLAILYYNGRLVLTVTDDCGAGTAWSRFSFGVTPDSTPYAYAPASVDLGLVFNRALSASEVAELYMDPYAAWRPKRTVVWFGSTAPGGVAMPVFVHHNKRLRGVA